MKGESVGDGKGLWMTPDDDVVTAIEDLEAGATFEVDGTMIELTEDVPFGHKVAIRDIPAGDEIFKYGYVIAKASSAIEAGDWVHTHNTEGTRGRGDLAAEGGEPA
jgi:altronate dehydratase small subunit